MRQRNVQQKSGIGLGWMVAPKTPNQETRIEAASVLMMKSDNMDVLVHAGQLNSFFFLGCNNEHDLLFQLLSIVRMLAAN
jgi:hypothetical protein